jgi:predicted acylesterase/phospholipase RssA
MERCDEMNGLYLLFCYRIIQHMAMNSVHKANSAATCRRLSHALTTSEQSIMCSVFMHMKLSQDVVCGGGAMYALMYLGALKRLFADNETAYSTWCTDVVRSATGTSAGALICIIIAFGIHPSVGASLIHECGVHRVVDAFMDDATTSMTRERALCSSMSIETALKTFMKVVVERSSWGLAQHAAKQADVGSTLTLQQMHQATGKHITFIVTNAQHGIPAYWSHDFHPNMPVWFALRCTTSVPVVFASPMYRKVPYVDGGITCNVGIDPAYRIRAKRARTLYSHPTLSSPAPAQPSLPSLMSSKLLGIPKLLPSPLVFMICNDMRASTNTAPPQMTPHCDSDVEDVSTAKEATCASGISPVQNCFRHKPPAGFRPSSMNSPKNPLASMKEVMAQTMLMYSDAAQFAAVRQAVQSDEHDARLRITFTQACGAQPPIASSCLSQLVPFTPSERTARLCGPLKQWSFCMSDAAVDALIEDGERCVLAVAIRHVLVVLLAVGLLSSRLSPL